MLSVLIVISSFKSKVPRGCNIVLLVKIKQITSSPRLVESTFGGTSSEWSTAGIIRNISSCWTRTRWLINWPQMTFCCSGSLGSYWGVTWGGGWGGVARAGLLCHFYGRYSCCWKVSGLCVVFWSWCCRQRSSIYGALFMPADCHTLTTNIWPGLLLKLTKKIIKLLPK